MIALAVVASILSLLIVAMIFIGRALCRVDKERA